MPKWPFLLPPISCKTSGQKKKGHQVFDLRSKKLQKNCNVDFAQ